MTSSASMERQELRVGLQVAAESIAGQGARLQLAHSRRTDVAAFGIGRHRTRRDVPVRPQSAKADARVPHSRETPARIPGSGPAYPLRILGWHGNSGLPDAAQRCAGQEFARALDAAWRPLGA